MLKPRRNVTTIKQGDFRVSRSPDDLFVCILGSCIATCFFDPVERLGGMNHFLLPGHDPHATGEVKYGAHSMEQLINGLLRAGASRQRLQVSIYGGAKVIKSGGQIGANNAQFAREFVRREGFRVVEVKTGGGFGRKLEFEPTLGTVKVDMLRAQTPLPRDSHTPSKPRPTGSVELF